MRLGVAFTVALAACGPAPRPAGPTGPVIPMAGAPGPRLGPEPAASPTALGAAWLDQVHARLHEKWAEGFLEQARVYLPANHPLNDRALAVVIELAVNSEGEVKQVLVAQPSGNADFDRSAREVVGALGTVPPPTADLLSDDGLVHVRWLFARDVRQDAVAGAAVVKETYPAEKAIPALLAGGRIHEAAARAAVAVAAGDDKVLPLARDVAGDALVAVLGADKEPARLPAVRGLGASGWHGGDAILTKLAVEATDLVLRSAALRALGDLGVGGAEPLCRTILDKGDAERGAAAAYALTRLGKGSDVWAFLAPRVASADDQTRIVALVELADVGAEAGADALITRLAPHGTGAAARAERVAAATALGLLATSATAPAARALLGALGDGDAAVRAAAAAGLARGAGKGLRGRGIYFAVEPLLRDRDPRVQAAALEAAALLDGKAALPEIGLAAARTRDPQVLEAAIGATAGVPGPEALAALRRFAKSENPEVRAAALRGLAARPEPEARSAAAAHLDDEDPRARAAAASAISEAPRLEKLLADPGAEVRAAAAAALVKAVGPKAATPPILDALAAAHEPRVRVALAAAYLRATRP